RELRRLALQIGERDLAPVTRLALPVVRDLPALPRFDVPVDAVVGRVQLAADVPPGVRELPLVQLRERLEPGDPVAALALPELLERELVDVRLRVRLRRERGRRREAPLLREQRLDRVPRHGWSSYGYSVRFSAPSSVTRTRSSSRTPPKPCR